MTHSHQVNQFPAAGLAPLRVLVTGASGFVGSAIVQALLRTGYNVLGFVRCRKSVPHGKMSGATFIEGDMSRPETYVPQVANVQAVIHAAQARPRGRWTRRKLYAMFQSDALMTRMLAEACLRYDLPLIYTSGALTQRGVGTEWIDELSPSRPCWLARGHAEMAAELRERYVPRGLRGMIVSPGFVYGPGGFLAESVALIRRQKYRVIGSGENYWGMIHVDDLADLYLKVLKQGCPGETYFACDDEPLPRRTVIDELTQALHLPRVGNVPEWLAGCFLGFPLVEALTSSIRMCNTRTRTALGWQPIQRSFRTALPAILTELQHQVSNIEGVKPVGNKGHVNVYDRQRLHPSSP